MVKVSEGDVGHLGLLFERHHKNLFSYFSRLLPAADVAEDLVQEVFFRVLKYKHTFQMATPFRFWLLRIARNVAMDHCRRTKVEVAMPEMVGEGGGPLERMVLEQDIEILGRAFAALSLEKRELLILSRFEEMKYADIAQLTGTNVPTIKVRVHRALNELRHFFNQASKEKVS